MILQVCVFCTQRGTCTIQTRPCDSSPAGVAHKANPFGWFHPSRWGPRHGWRELPTWTNQIHVLQPQHHSLATDSPLCSFALHHFFLYCCFPIHCLFFTYICIRFAKKHDQDNYLCIIWYISIRCNTDYTHSHSQQFMICESPVSLITHKCQSYRERVIDNPQHHLSKCHYYWTSICHGLDFLFFKIIFLIWLKENYICLFFWFLLLSALKSLVTISLIAQILESCKLL